MNQDELEVAKLAALVGGELKKVDSTTIERNSRGPANKLDPRSFISQPVRTQQGPTRQLNVPGMVQQQRTVSAGRDVVGTQAVDVRDLLIPMEGDLKDRVKNIVPPSSSAVPGTEPKTIVTAVTSTTIDKKENKDIDYIKKKLRVIEKNQDKIIEMLGKIINEN